MMQGTTHSTRVELPLLPSFAASMCKPTGTPLCVLPSRLPSPTVAVSRNDARNAPRQSRGPSPRLLCRSRRPAGGRAGGKLGDGAWRPPARGRKRGRVTRKAKGGGPDRSQRPPLRAPLRAPLRPVWHRPAAARRKTPPSRQQPREPGQGRARHAEIEHLLRPRRSRPARRRPFSAGTCNARFHLQCDFRMAQKYGPRFAHALAAARLSCLPSSLPQAHPIAVSLPPSLPLPPSVPPSLPPSLRPSLTVAAAVRRQLLWVAAASFWSLSPSVKASAWKCAW